MSNVVTRFAPSPTGLMHLGNVRTALLNWMFARKMDGKFLLRFEDTDQSRSEQKYIDALKEDMLWLGLQWDDEPLFQSKHAGQHQSARR
jgi:glutamyl/glutaminyl-tRNA synthetase